MIRGVSVCVLLLSSILRAGADISDCSHTFAGGQTFDLSGLRKPEGDRDWYADDRNGNMYYFNVCGDANLVPAACVSLEKAVQAPAYQVASNDDCFWLGRLTSMEWELIDDEEPSAGIELYYFDGEQCSNGLARDFRIQMFCDPDAGVGKPLDYFVLEEDCHYSVTWPSKYGCPVDAGIFGQGSGGAITYLCAGILVYLVLGLVYNVTHKEMALGVEALPHIQQWSQLLEGLLGLGLALRDRLAAMVGHRSPGGYRSVNGSVDGPYDSY